MESNKDSSLHLPILYRDEHYIAIHKPSGLLVHRSPIDKHETRFAVQELRDQIGQTVHPVHRLDRPTSGILIFAFDTAALAALAAAFEEKRIQKTYQAIVRGFAPEAGLIDHPLRKFEDDDARIKSDHSQEARTRFQTLATAELPIPFGKYPSTRYSLLELRPETGRRHQIRRHLVHINCPIIGDTRYGDSRHNTHFRKLFAIQRLFLAATRIAFEHPITQESIVIDCPLAPEFQDALRRTGLKR